MGTLVSLVSIMELDGAANVVYALPKNDLVVLVTFRGIFSVYPILSYIYSFLQRA